MNTVACVLRTGGVYTADWVAKLARNVHRFADVDRFVCLTDAGSIAGVETIPLAHDWPGWWSKMELFRPDLDLGERVLYLDLDTVITDRIDHLWSFDGFGAIRDFYRPNQPASGVMLWTSEDAPHEVYQAMRDNPPVQQGRADFWWPKHVPGTVISLQRVFPETFASYKGHGLVDGPKHYAVVCFHGSPKQDDLDGTWVGEFWR